MLNAAGNLTMRSGGRPCLDAVLPLKNAPNFLSLTHPPIFFSINYYFYPCPPPANNALRQPPPLTHDALYHPTSPVLPANGFSQPTPPHTSRRPPIRPVT